MTADPAGQVFCDYGDGRRAAVLLLHFAAQNTAGVDAVIAETAHADRSLELVAQLLHLVCKMFPEVRSEEALGRLQNIALMMAGGEQ